MSEKPIKIERDELFDRTVDEALKLERAGRERIVASTPSVSPVRRLLFNPLFYLPTAALLGALATWMLLEPKINDMPSVRGEVILVNADTFDGGPGIIALTVGKTSVYLDPAHVKFERGADGEPAFKSIDEIQVGTRIEAVGQADGARLLTGAIRPAKADSSPGRGLESPLWPLLLLFPLTALLISFGLLVAEGISTRNWLRMIERTLLGSLLATVFALLAYLPAGIVGMISQAVQQDEFAKQLAKHPNEFITIHDISAGSFLLIAALRSVAWACIGAATGLGMNLVRSTRSQLRNAVIGGALGGAFGGLFFDPIDRFLKSTMFADGSMSRLVGLLAVGLSIGVFVALVERLARDAWLRVRTGPLAGKSFILYKTPTVIGSAPASDVYLYKDADIDAAHLTIHRVGMTYEIEDLGSRMGTTVGGTKIRRRRLVSGDQIVIGSTILDFEERQKRT